MRPCRSSPSELPRRGGAYWLAAVILGAPANGCAGPPEITRVPTEDPAAWHVQYRGEPQRRGLAPRGATLDTPPRLVWRTRPLGIGVYTASKSSPAVDGDRVYVGEDDGLLYALDRETGAIAWAFATHRHDQEARDPPADGAFTGIHGSPALDAERVYVGDYAGWLYAVERRSGELVWERHLGGSIGASPALDGDALHIAVEEPAPDGRVFGVAPATGEITFVSDWLGHHPHASVSRLGAALFVGTNAGALVRLDPSVTSPSFTVTTGGAVKSTAAVTTGAEGAVSVYFTSGDGQLYAVDGDSGAIRFTVATEALSMSSPAVAEGHVIFGSHDGVVRCVDAADGALDWAFDAGAWVSSSPTVILESRLVAVGTNAGEVLGLDLDDGTERFRLVVDAAVTSVPVVVDRSVFVNDDGGTVYRFDAE